MARAVLTIEADTSSVVRAMGDLRGVARASQAAMTAEARRGAKDREKAARDEVRQQHRLDLEGLRSARDAARGRTAVEVAQIRARTAASTQASREEMQRQRLTTALYLNSERARTAATTREEAARTRATQAEETRRMRLRAQMARESVRQQRAAERDRIGTGTAIARGGMAAGRAAGAFATGAHGMFQDARRQRAATESTLNSAFYQARIGGPEAAGMRERLQREVASGSLRGLSLETVAEGLSAAQTQFNVLGGASPQARAQGMDRQIALMGFARNTYQDPGEVLRVAGMLQQQGVTGADQMSTIRAMTGMAQAGSIELANVTREALGPLMQNIARSVTAGMTADQRSAAVRSATLETMAVGEVTARAGGRSRDMLNALSKTRGSITNERTQENLYARLRGAGPQGQALAASMFTMQNGRARLNEGTSAVGFLSQLVAGFGGDTNRVTNLLGAGGPGAPMVLDAQQRRLLLLLASQGQGGESIAQNVATMQREGSRFSAADVERGRQMRDEEAATTLQANEETRLNALTDNTSKLVRLSTSIDSWVRANPLAAQGVQSGGGLLGGLLGGAAAPALARTAARVLPALAPVGQAVTGVTGAINAIGAGGGIAAQGAAVAASLGVAGLAGGAINRAMGHTQQSDNPFSANFYTEFGRSVRDAIRDGIAAAPITAQIDPHTAAQARSAGAAPAR